MDLISLIAFFVTGLQSEWVEAPDGAWSRDYACTIEMSDKTSPDQMNALPEGLEFTLAVEATEDEFTSVRLTMVSPDHDRPLILESETCLSDPITRNEDGHVTMGGETYQCAIDVRRNQFVTLYGPQEAGWFTLLMAKGGVETTDGDPDVPAPPLYFDTYQGRCL